MNLLEINDYIIPEYLENKILEFWKKQRKLVTGDGDCSQLNVSENSIGFDHYEYLEKYGSPGRSDWYDIEGELAEEIYKFCPAKPEETYGIGLLEITNDKLAPHVDPSDVRTHCINYTLIKGGDVINRWYNLLPEFQNKVFEPSFIPYERLEIAETHYLEDHKWYQLNTSVIHSVENVNDVRLTISIPLVSTIK